MEISQYIMIGDLTVCENPPVTQLDSEPTLPAGRPVTLPSFSFEGRGEPYTEVGPRPTNEGEDALLEVCFYITMLSFSVNIGNPGFYGKFPRLDHKLHPAGDTAIRKPPRRRCSWQRRRC